MKTICYLQARYAPEAHIEVGTAVSPDDGGGMERTGRAAEPGLDPLHDSQTRYVAVVSLTLIDKKLSTAELTHTRLNKVLI